MTTHGETKLLQAVEVWELVAEQMLAGGDMTEEDQREGKRLLEDMRACRRAFIEELPNR